MVKRGLGKGLEALIPKTEHKDRDFVNEIEVKKIFPNLFQPRKNFNREKLDELKESIKIHGLIQPIVVRKVSNGYELVAGERRLKAVKELKLKKIPVIIKNFGNEKSLEIALVENIQREDLNLIDQANGFKRLMDEFELTQQELAEVTAKSRALISNTVRLLRLNVKIQRDISEGKISFGHAKLLLGIEDEGLQLVICDKISSNNLSVRETEKLIKNINRTPKKKLKVENITIENFPEAEEQLRNILGTKIKILYNGKKGQITIDFYNKEDLRRIVKLLVKRD
ncbi:MAG: ParB/RepB/Spo0J family partition protein [Candidatus Caldatribacteriota bacterium]|nr:ParB/RepB/Spo0J family partition protein [Candidatus Caldatribacteriota bacterium]